MADKKVQENPIPEDQAVETTEIPKDVPKQDNKPTNIVPTPVALPKPTDKTMTTVPLPAPPPTVVPPRVSVPGFTKTPPNDLYRRLLPAVLFVLTFVTVMTMLLIYMDTVALGAQKFRANMSRDYELARIPQGSAALVAFVQQLHLAPRRAAPAAGAAPEPPPRRTPQVALMEQLHGPIYNGTFVEFLARGSRDGSGVFLERARGWAGVVVRAAARDYLALRGAARALHACLSPTAHPREVTYQETESPESVFRSRVLCLPLLTVLLAADAAAAQYVLLGGPHAPAALQHLPFRDPRLRLQMIEVQFSEEAARSSTTQHLLANNYTVAGAFPGSVMYALRPL